MADQDNRVRDLFLGLASAYVAGDSEGQRHAHGALGDYLLEGGKDELLERMVNYTVISGALSAALIQMVVAFTDNKLSVEDVIAQIAKADMEKRHGSSS